MLQSGLFIPLYAVQISSARCSSFSFCLVGREEINARASGSRSFRSERLTIDVLFAPGSHADAGAAGQSFQQQRLQFFAAADRTATRPGVPFQGVGQPQRMPDDFAFIGEPAGRNLLPDNALVIWRERKSHMHDFPTNVSECQAPASP